MDHSSLTRRGAIGVLAGGAAAALSIDPSFAQYIRIRENITTFAANPTKLAALKMGVQVMQQRSKSNSDDPTGWSYWAASHGTDQSVPLALSNIYNQCRHGSPHFYSWHRAFLYYFEQTLRAASGDPTLNLPYWNWYSTPTIPAAFTTPADSSNPLYHPRFNNTVGTLSQSPFTRSTLLEPPIPGFSRDLEFDPHGAVHDDIGDDMGSIATSARDPIFWLHHCNVDRLWNVWINQGHSNPAASDPWSAQSFTFDTAGTMKKSAGQVTNTETMLGYKYDNENSPLTTPLLAVNWKVILAMILVAKPFHVPGPGPVEKSIVGLALARNAQVASALTTGFALGTKSSQINFQVSGANGNRIRAFAAGARPPTDEANVDLVLDGVKITEEGRNGGYSFRVCVAVPTGNVSARVLDRQCVGQFGSFEISVALQHARMAGGNQDGSVTLRFPLGAALKALGPKAVGESVPVTFVARHAAMPAGQGNRTYITVKSAHLELGRAL